MDRYTKVMVAMVVSVMLASIAAMVTVGLIQVVREWDEPYCPQEDSCSIDYRDGAWHITENEPGTY